MGDAFAYKCRKCGYEEYFNQGHGFLVHPQSVKEYLGLRTKLFHYKTHNKIVRLAKENKNLMIKATFQIYICPNCELLYDKAEVKVYDENKTIHRSRFRCSHCNSKLKLTNIHRLSRATCPVCKKKTFHRDHALHELWD
ncbi:MAG: hypothetical protein JXR31_05510 [Prolixibacteraceae bacterium]|nr:hypothetical protein [Prolixibacteraceae bacterium]MBN2773685.1 hypothetical protein [Prolixibacteraceae bacterium]